jgi:hypothetical protein
MGAAISTSGIDIINNAIINVAINQSQNCSSSVTANQTVTESGFGLDTTNTQTTAINLSCLQNVTVNASIISQMTAAIQQATTASSVALLPAYSGSNATTAISNLLSASISASFIQTCASSAIANQSLAISGVQIGTSNTQDTSAFSSCMSTALMSTNIAQSLTGQTSNTTSSSASADPLSDISDTVMYIIIVIIVIVAAGIGLIIYMTMGSDAPEPKAAAMSPPLPSVAAVSPSIVAT